MDDHQEAGMTNKEQTYDVSNLFRKCETQNGEHALEWILMLINSVIHVPTNHCKRDTAQWGEGRATRTRRKGQVCLGNANIQGWVLARATTRVKRDACTKRKNKS